MGLELTATTVTGTREVVYCGSTLVPAKSLGLTICLASHGDGAVAQEVDRNASLGADFTTRT